MTKTGTVALAAAVVAVGTTQAFVPSTSFTTATRGAVRNTATTCSMGAERSNMNPVVAAAMGLILAGSDPAGLIHMNPQPPSVQALQTPDVQTAADAVKAGNGLLGNDPTGGANNGLFANSQAGREAKLFQDTPGGAATKAGASGQIPGNAGKAAADVASRVGGAKDTVAQKAGQAGSAAGNAGDISIAGRNAGDAKNAAKDAVAGKVGTDLDRASSAASKVGQAASNPAGVAQAAKNAVKGVSFKSQGNDVYNGAFGVGFTENAVGDAASRAQGGADKIAQAGGAVRNTPNVKIAGRDAGDAVDAIKGAVGGKVAGDINKAGNAIDRPQGGFETAKNNLQGAPGKVSSDINTAKRAVGVGWFGNAKAALDLAGDAKQATDNIPDGAKDAIKSGSLWTTAQKAADNTPEDAKNAAKDVARGGDLVSNAKKAADSIPEDQKNAAKDAAKNAAGGKGGDLFSSAKKAADNAPEGAKDAAKDAAQGGDLVANAKKAADSLPEDQKNAAKDAAKNAAGGQGGSLFSSAKKAADNAPEGAKNAAKDAAQGGDLVSNAKKAADSIPEDQKNAAKDAAKDAAGGQGGSLFSAAKKAADSIPEDQKNAAKDAAKDAAGGQGGSLFSAAKKAADNAPEGAKNAAKDATQGGDVVASAKKAADSIPGDAKGAAKNAAQGAVDKAPNAGDAGGAFAKIRESIGGQGDKDESLSARGPVQAKEGEFQLSGKNGQKYQTERPNNKQGIPGVTDQKSVQAQ